MATFLPRQHFARLLETLEQAGYELIGPQIRDGAVTLVPITAQTPLPTGWQEQQEAGQYRLEHTVSPRQFLWTTAPQGLKPLVFAPTEPLWRARTDDGELRFEPQLPPPRRRAVIGVRACDLAALQLQDAHFLQQGVVDSAYQRRREGLFLVAINCARSAASCFCASTGDGPAATAGYDLLLDELDEGFIVQAESGEAKALIAKLSLQPASDAQLQQAQAQVEAAVRQQTRRLPSRDLSGLYQQLDHPHWKTVGQRCLACGNCTAVCPTCFCWHPIQATDIEQDQVEYRREWDSCFNSRHSHLAGHQVRPAVKDRYRQWLTHKLAGWHAQYGRSGCVGCGRCVTWCPVAIDLTEEVPRLQEPPDG